MTRKIILYRGDSEKIRCYDVRKTNEYCLLGKGVYLSDSLSVAKSYMDKGGDDSNCFTLFEGSASNRLDAYEKAFGMFLKIYFKKHPMYSRDIDEKSKVYLNITAEARNRYNSLIVEGNVKADYVAQQRRAASKFLTVTYSPENTVGYVTKFEFPEHEFNTAVFKVDGRIRDEFFWELMWDNKVEFGTQHDCKATYIKMNSDGHSIPSFRPMFSLRQMVKSGYVPQHNNWRNKKALMIVKQLLIPYGYKGFEYNGGGYVGGNGKHRAFSMWDDEFVNDCKVERFKP